MGPRKRIAVAWHNLTVFSVNRHLNVVEEFERVSDPGSYVVWGISPW